jgi:Uncharacterized protein conserved in bacteria (DUF2330)
MRKLCAGLMAATALAAGTLAMEGDARACGGCFHPPPGPQENPSMVTAHRMILSVSAQQTTLYDQIKYTGNPKDFAWVLPINGSAKVGLSADVVFTTLGSLTETSVAAPPMNCPLPPSGCTHGFGEDNGAPTASGAGGSSSGGGLAADAGVVVTHEEQVGPYETVQLHASDPTALNTWLGDHGYVIPADVQPVISAYVNEHYDFLALKLAPNQGVSAMRPVRVSTAGGSPVLPLRMVAAGTGATVGITLWVIGEGRYEPQNFPGFQIAASDLVWDWQTSSSNFAQLRADRTTASGGRAWETENSTDLQTALITSIILNGSSPGSSSGSTGNVDYLGVDGGGDGGAAGESPNQVRQDDLDTLFAGMQGSSVRVTRLRSDLAHAALATDLVLQAAADQSVLPLLRQVTKEANEPTCTIYQGCDVIGQGPRSQAIAAAANNTGGKESFSCAATKKAPTGTVVYAGLLGLAAISLVRSRRRSNKR